MPRWVLAAPLGLVVLAGALFAFRYGWIAANMTETAAIEAYAARYLREAGPAAVVTDCTARPGTRVWLVVVCARGAQVWEYRVNRFGGLVGLSTPEGRGAEEARSL